MADITYGALIGQIISRLNRDDLDQIARDFAVDRIDYYKKECFYAWRLNDQSITTVQGTSDYNFPTGFEQVLSIELLNGVWLPVTKIDYDDLAGMDVNEPSVQGVPTYWAPFGSTFTLFPSPGAAYSLRLTMDLPSGPPAENATNFWTGDAKSLVIAGTCAEVWEMHIRGDEATGQRFRRAEAREMTSLSSKTIRLRGGIQIAPYL